MAKAMEEVSRRNSGSHRRVSPQMSLTVPNSGSAQQMLQPSPSASSASGGGGAVPGGGVMPPGNGAATARHLAPPLGGLPPPPTESELQAQRRFSEVNAAIERHNSRRQAKRSQSVMYRNKKKTNRRNSEIGGPDFDPFQQHPNAVRQQQQLQQQQQLHLQQQQQPYLRVIPGLQPPLPLQATRSAPSPSMQRQMQ